ncbi:hypothetical protein HQQ82_01460 [Rathayibacter sp. VKM Ac-2856]|uniref:hypothetical protein n=1 Tax=unclassified Rathayibacter TaxID=2609250 RepID=UPI001567641E|nr:MULTISPECIES: hypothetical protein [unclassified Rathayibacter]NQX03462.1 hypothetical protein [Rathayibacter sp. VKM Ac-2858]NQX18630.1 hypothetical protein [Rathayibacter sp. VKM Ac-2856]
MGRRVGCLAGLAIVVLAVTGCGSGGSDPSAAGELIGWGTVIESGPGSGVPQLCLSGVAESAPPQCTGDAVALIGLDWAALTEVPEVGGTRWFDGTFHGTWDGSAITLTRPFAVGDQTGLDQDDAVASAVGSADSATLAQALEAIRARSSDDPNYVNTAEYDGTLHLVVVHDDGSIQADLDREIGPGVVVVHSALRAV